MIKITRIDKPDELTDEKVKELTVEYINEGKSVWDKKYIKDTLLKMSNDKCCFCEIKLGEEGKYMTVEHFHHKSAYPHEVVKWDNLLPACNRCNSNKSTHDTYKEPIIDPTVNDPRDYFYLQDYRYKIKNNNNLAKTTIDVLYINDTDKLVYPRFKVGNEAHKKLEDIHDNLNELLSDSKINIRKRNKIIGGLKDLLNLAQPDKEYSAVLSTVILNDDIFLAIVDKLKNNELWDSELEDLKINSEKIMFTR